MLRVEVEDLVSRSSSSEKPRRSLSLSLPSRAAVNGGAPRRSFSYSKLPEEPIKLSVLKLDGSSFDVEVIKSATVAELKLAVQDVFSDTPKRGPGKISWPHVWGHFCLSYDDQKLVTDTDPIINYGIKDGDQLQFIRHVSSIETKVRAKRSMTLIDQKQSYMPISSEQNDEEEDDDDYDYMETGRYQNHNNQKTSIVVDQECQFGSLWRGWSSSSRMSNNNRTSSGPSKGIVCQSGCDRSLLDNFRKILQLWGSTKYSPKQTLKAE